VTFDAGTRTLILDGANISLGLIPESSDTFAGIISLNGDLTIELRGSNNLVDISESSSSNYVAGVWIENGNLTLSGAGSMYVRANHTLDSDRAKSFDVSGQIIVPNSAHIEYFGDYTATDVNVTSPATFTAGTTFPSPGGPGGPVGPILPSEALYVNGVDFLTEANRITVPGVTVNSFSDTAVTLTLDNANIIDPYTSGSWQYGIFSSNKDVTIILANDNVIEIPTSPGTTQTGIFVNNGNLTIQGTGTLDVSGSQQSIQLVGDRIQY
jgi:hypothetical protein